MCGIVWEVISDKISVHSYSREGRCLEKWGGGGGGGGGCVCGTGCIVEGCGIGTGGEA